MSDSESIAIPRRTIEAVLRVIAIVVVIAALVVIGFAVSRNLGGQDSLANAIRANRYQAVFLSSGQVYFGKLKATGGSFAYLTDVYSLETQSSRSGTAGRTLVKLTSDVQGPEDFLAINRRDILYVENLRPNGKAARLLAGG
ncbi:MAG: hypothetical protein ACRDFS_12940 [Chloroflexota bacterium]